MGYTYRCRVVVNGFLLFTHQATYEETCLNRCRRYMTEFQRKVANVEMRVEVYHRKTTTEPWKDKHNSFEFKRAIIRKPLQKKTVESHEEKQEE